MKKMSKEKQMQANGGYLYPWVGACTSCSYQFEAAGRRDLLEKGYAHYKANYTKRNPHRWVYLSTGY